MITHYKSSILADFKGFPITGGGAHMIVEARAAHKDLPIPLDLDHRLEITVGWDMVAICKIM